MRTLTTTLLAAQRVHPQSPRVRVLVRDKQPRFALIGTAGATDAQCAECVSGSTTIVAVLATTGRIMVRRVTDRSTLDPTGDAGAGWGLYTGGYTQVVAAGGALGWPLGDVAISNNSGTIRLFYIKADGTEVLSITSTDAGATWGSPATVRAVDGGAASYPFHLASAGHDDLWYTVEREGYRYLYVGYYSGGAWGGWTHVQYIMETGGEYENFYGLSVVWNSTTSVYEVAASLDRASNGDGRIVTCEWDPAVPELGSYQGIVPPGLPAVGATAVTPCLFKTSSTLGSLYVLTYWDKFASGSSSWTTPMAMLSRDFEHWSYKIPLGFTAAANDRRICVTEADSAVYLHAMNEAYELELWYSGKADAELTIAQGKVLRLRIRESPASGDTHIEVDNRGGTYDSDTALLPLARLYVDLGVKTSAGDERVESRPFYLWETSRVCTEGVNLMRLHGVDGWQLLEMWRPDCTIQWEGKTLGWCIEEIAARAGWFEVEFDSSTVWSESLTYLTVVAQYNDWSDLWYIRAWGRWVPLDGPTVMFGDHLSGRAILERLLGLVGGQAKWGNGDSRDVLYCFVPSEQGEAPAAVHTYGDGELMYLQYVDSFAWPTRVRVIGTDLTVEDEDIANGLDAGMDFLQVVQASQWTTAAQLGKIADGALDDADARAYGGWFRTRPNAGLELFDVVAFTESRAGAGLSQIRRRVTGIETRYEPGERVWQQEVKMEGL